MSVSVLIPAHNEQAYLNRTIENIFDTATGEIEVIVVLNGYEQEVDERAEVFRYQNNEGERVAMNMAATMATKTHLLRIDAHCDFSPKGWDEMMEKETGEKRLTVAVLTALEKETWKRLPGHWYGMCRFIKSETKGKIGLEAKWEKPNRDHDSYRKIEPNMACTGCGFMIRKDFYWSIGGADELLPKMGAIGEEFSVKTWLAGGKVQTRTDVMIGHIFGTGGYDTGEVQKAQQMLFDLYGDKYDWIVAKFPKMNIIKLKPTAVLQDKKTVTVNREDTHTIRDSNGKTIKQVIERFRYVWIDDGSGLTEEEVCKKYAPLATKIDETTLIANDKGEMVEQKESKT